MGFLILFRLFSNFTAKDGEDFVAIVDLPEGEHQYKFLIDEEWKFNPQEARQTLNLPKIYLLTL